MKKNILLISFVFWTVFLFAQNIPPVAVNDTALTWKGYAKIDVLDNDYDVEDNLIKILIIYELPKHGYATKSNDSIITYWAYPSFPGGVDSLKYIIRDINKGSFDTAMVYISVENSLRFDSLEMNNIKAGFNSNGNLFNEYKHTYNVYRPFFEVPRYSRTSTIYRSSMWICALDENDSMHITAPFEPDDTVNCFWEGPVSDVYDTAYEIKFGRVWKVTKADIDYHLDHCWQGGYLPDQRLIDWPGNGDTTLGQAAILAPFHDWNNDGIYNPYAGDYPIIKGDEAVFFMCNDMRKERPDKLGFELHGMAYVFDCPADSALWNTVFINYKIFNRSGKNYHDVLIGAASDIDLGYSLDDYIECDVPRSSYFCYNADNFDGPGFEGQYGSYPPVQAVTILAGPYMDADGNDNTMGLCDESVNGLNFGNGIADDERLGMTRFMSFGLNQNYTGNSMSDPQTMTEYFNCMHNMWRDSTMTQWGGNAHVDSAGVCGPECNFMFSASTDTCYWGTSGMAPLCSPDWTEIVAGNHPLDKRGIGISGPFTFNQNTVQEYDVAFTYARNFSDTNSTAGIPILKQRIDSLMQYFRNDTTPCGSGFSGIVPTPKTNPQINIYPNPAIGYITVDATGMLCDLNYEIYDILGRNIDHGLIKCTSSNLVSISGLDSGIYIINISDGKNKFSRKFIKQ